MMAIIRRSNLPLNIGYTLVLDTAYFYVKFIPSVFSSPYCRELECVYNDVIDRLVFHLLLISEKVEVVVSTSINDHLKSNLLSENHQSSYRKCHKTETTIFKVNNDLLISADEKKVPSIALILDLSAAFDIIT